MCKVSNSLLAMLLALILATGLLSACGKKGPLYRPGQNQGQQQ